MRSVIAQLPMWRQGNPETNMVRAVQLAGLLDASRNSATRYRAAVLDHPDLAARLCSAFGYTDARQWKGYVPPRLDDGSRYNSSPSRAVLVELVTEALKRNDDWTDDDAERLNPVPEAHIQAPWREQQNGGTA